jgi:hypothetical protein
MNRFSARFFLIADNLAEFFHRYGFLEKNRIKRLKPFLGYFGDESGD